MTGIEKPPLLSTVVGTLPGVNPIFADLGTVFTSRCEVDSRTSAAGDVEIGKAARLTGQEFLGFMGRLPYRVPATATQCPWQITSVEERFWRIDRARGLSYNADIRGLLCEISTDWRRLNRWMTISLVPLFNHGIQPFLPRGPAGIVDQFFRPSKVPTVMVCPQLPRLLRPPPAGAEALVATHTADDTSWLLRGTALDFRPFPPGPLPRVQYQVRTDYRQLPFQLPAPGQDGDVGVMDSVPFMWVSMEDCAVYCTLAAPQCAGFTFAVMPDGVHTSCVQYKFRATPSRSGRFRIVNGASSRALYAQLGDGRDGLGAGRPEYDVHDDGVWYVTPCSKASDETLHAITNAYSGRILAVGEGNWGDNINAFVATEGFSPCLSSNSTWNITLIFGNRYRITSKLGRALYAANGSNWGNGVGAGSPPDAVHDDGAWILEAIGPPATTAVANTTMWWRLNPYGDPTLPVVSPLPPFGWLVAVGTRCSSVHGDAVHYPVFSAHDCINRVRPQVNDTSGLLCVVTDEQQRNCWVYESCDVATCPKDDGFATWTFEPDAEPPWSSAQSGDCRATINETAACPVVAEGVLEGPSYQGYPMDVTLGFDEVRARCCAVCRENATATLGGCAAFTINVIGPSTAKPLGYICMYQNASNLRSASYSQTPQTGYVSSYSFRLSPWFDQPSVDKDDYDKFTPATATRWSFEPVCATANNCKGGFLPFVTDLCGTCNCAMSGSLRPQMSGGTDYYGNDHIQSAAHSAEECGMQCTNNEKCFFWTWMAPGTCFQKATGHGKRPAWRPSHYVSGTRLGLPFRIANGSSYSASAGTPSSLQLGYLSASYCQAACIADPSCTHFNYVLKDISECTLMSVGGGQLNSESDNHFAGQVVCPGSMLLNSNGNCVGAMA